MLRNLAPLVCLALTLVSTSVEGHGTEVRRCFSAGVMRIYVEHWHGVLNQPSDAGTMQIRDDQTGIVNTLTPIGLVNNVAPAALPCPGSATTEESSCNVVHDHWVYFEFTPDCNKPVSYTFLAGDTVVLKDGCVGSPGVYPITVSGTFADNTAPAFDIDGSGGCNDISLIVPGPSPVSFSSAISDACDANPAVTSGPTPASGSTFSLGCTVVTVTGVDASSNVGTCTFNVCLATPGPTPNPTDAPNNQPQAVVVNGDPFTSYNGKTTQFYLPLGEEQLLLTCPGVELLGRARASGMPGDTQQWFDHFTVRPTQGSHQVSVGVRDWHKLQPDSNATGSGAATETVAAALLGSRGQQPLTTLDVIVDGAVVAHEATLTGSSSWRVAVARGAKRIGSGHSDVVTVHAGDVQIRMQSAVADKFATAEEKLRHMHVDLDFDGFDAKPCSGVLPEVWGVKPMSAATARLLAP